MLNEEGELINSFPQPNPDNRNGMGDLAWDSDRGLWWISGILSDILVCSPYFLSFLLSIGIGAIHCTCIFPLCYCRGHKGGSRTGA